MEQHYSGLIMKDILNLTELFLSLLVPSLSVVLVFQEDASGGLLEPELGQPERPHPLPQPHLRDPSRQLSSTLSPGAGTQTRGGHRWLLSLTSSSTEGSREAGRPSLIKPRCQSTTAIRNAEPGEPSDGQSWSLRPIRRWTIPRSPAEKANDRSRLDEEEVGWCWKSYVVI